MAATVLNSKRAVELSVFVVRAFVRLREMFSTNQKVVNKLLELERRLEGQDSTIREIVDTIRALMTPPRCVRKRIGFQVPTKAG